MRTSSYPAYPMNFPRGCRNLSLPFCLFPTVNRAERPAQLGSCRIQRKIHDNRQRASTTFHSPVAGGKWECARRARRYVKTCQPCESYEQSVAYASPRSNVPFAADFHLFARVRFYSWHDRIRSFNKWLLSSREDTLIRTFTTFSNANQNLKHYWKYLCTLRLYEYRKTIACTAFCSTVPVSRQWHYKIFLFAFRACVLLA